jgi:hypothetical protein
MTKLLEKAVEQLKRLPSKEQDEFANLLWMKLIGIIRLIKVRKNFPILPMKI